MNTKIYGLRSLLAAAAVVAVAQVAVAAKGYPAPVSIVAGKDGKTLYVAESVAKKIAIVDMADRKVVSRVSLRGAPTGLALSPATGILFATCSGPDGQLCLVDTGRGRVKDRLTLGHTPMSPVVSRDGKTVYVCNRFGNSVSVVDVEKKKELATIPVPREPIAATLSSDGKYLFVANHLPAGRADGDYTASVVSVIDTASRKVAHTIALPNGSTALRGICISPDGKYVYVTHILARYNVPTTQLERGWINTNAMTIIDAAGKKLVATVLLDDVDRGAANPWGIGCTADGKYVCVTLAGTHEIAVVNLSGMHKKLLGPAADNAQNDLSFLVGHKRRLKLAGNGPRAIVVVGSTVFAAEFFSDSVGIVDVNPSSRSRAASISLGVGEKMSVVRRGEMQFNDADVCFQQWQSCASCHPDSRTDGLNWDLLNDGMGNSKQTKSLLLAHKTPPAMVTGIRANATVAVRAGIKYIQFAVRPEEYAVAVDEYLKSMEPVPSPYLVKGRLSEKARRGEKVFKQAMCGSCHSGELLTDMKQYDLGSGKGQDAGRPLDTPTLIEAWRTGPYLHDGRAATIREVLTTHNEGDSHGQTSGLTAAQIKELEAYILSR